MMGFDFTDKRVLVTGGTRGIESAVVNAFYSAGAYVAVNGRTVDSVKKAIGTINDTNRLIAAPGDVGTVSGCEDAVKSALEGLGGLDILVNSTVSLTASTPAHDSPPDPYSRSLQVVH